MSDFQFADCGATYMEPSPVIAQRGGELYQIWYCKNTGAKEWRIVPHLDQAMQEYNCYEIR